MTTKQEIRAQQTEAYRTIAERVGGEFGYNRVGLNIGCFKDFKVIWTRSWDWIEFSISDYMVGMPEDAMAELFDTVYRKIQGGSEAAEYGPLATAWLTRPEFAEQNRPVFLARSETVARAEPMLDSVREDLIAEGLLTDADRAIPLYAKAGLGRGKAFGWSILMRTGFVAPFALVPGSNLLRKAVYLACKGAQLPFDPTGNGPRIKELVASANALFGGQ